MMLIVAWILIENVADKDKALMQSSGIMVWNSDGC